MGAASSVESEPALSFGKRMASRWLRERPLACWIATFALVGAASMLRLALGAGPAPFLAFYPAIMAATLLGGRPTGYVAFGASALIAGYLLIGPAGAPAFDGEKASALALFLIVSTAVVELLAYIGRRADALHERQEVLAARAQELAEREAGTAARLHELEALYDTAPIGLGFLDRELRFVRINQTLADMNGPSPADHIGRCVWDILPNLRESAEPVLRRVLEHGEILTGVELSGETPSRPGEQRNWIEMFYPVVGADGEIHGIGLCCNDVTDITRAQERERLLMREVDHRAKNLLTVVQSVLHLTRSAQTVADYRAAVTGRIQALGRVHTILAENRWDGVPLADLLRQELAPYGPTVEMSEVPEQIVLPPSPAQAVSMILHELTTNSAKHGALSAGGRVELGCVTRDTRITLSWAEHGGPLVAPPERNGFGTTLIQTAVKRLLGGTLDLRFEPGGLICEIEFPLPVPGKPAGKAAYA